MSNSLDQAQAQSLFVPDLGPSCMQRISQLAVSLVGEESCNAHSGNLFLVFKNILCANTGKFIWIFFYILSMSYDLTKYLITKY